MTRQSSPQKLRFICADAPVMASVINFFLQILINCIDINALTRLKFSKFSIINVLNAFQHISEKINFWYKGPPL